MRVSKVGIELIAEFEGLVDHLYNDPVGHCTVGYGHLLHQGRCDGRSNEGSYRNGISKTDANALLRTDIGRFEECVERLITVPLNQNQFDALVSFAFNVGCGALESSTLRRLLNEGRYDEVCDQLRRWNRGGGVVLPGLTRRREAECTLFNQSGQASPPAEEDDMAVDEQLREIVKDLKDIVQLQGEEVESLKDLTAAHVLELASLHTAVGRLAAVAHDERFDSADWQSALTTHEDNPDAHHA